MTVLRPCIAGVVTSAECTTVPSSRVTSSPFFRSWYIGPCPQRRTRREAAAGRASRVTRGRLIGPGGGGGHGPRWPLPTREGGSWSCLTLWQRSQTRVRGLSCRTDGRSPALLPLLPGSALPPCTRTHQNAHASRLLTHCQPTPRGGGVQSRLAASICQPRHDRMEHGPTEPHAGRGTFLLSLWCGGRVLPSGR